ncbi:MAG: ABC transporter substrate-binding protein [Ilumatobacteraceae bacterium]
MDYKVFDRARRNASPLELDLVESFAQGRISRRNFVKRGTLIGLSVPLMGSIIAACGSDETPASGSTATTAASAGSTATTVATGGSTAGSTATTAGAGAAGGIIRLTSQSPSGPLDPVTMVDLGSYGIIAQCFEYLCTLGEGGDIGPGLAESWSPNDDGSVWTFKLRSGVKWQDGADFVADDVVATMKRLVVNGNSDLTGVIDETSAVATDPLTVTFTLLSANGLFPYLVSLYNSQSAITPTTYETGTTLDATPNGTGPFKLVKYDSATGATFEKNPDWWGGAVSLDGSQWLFSDSQATQVQGLQSGAADAIVQFSVLGGDAIFNDPSLKVLSSRTATHREIWMRCDEGQFVDKAVRQAIALCLDRQLMVDNLFNGQADLGNDHPIAPVYPFFDDSIPQRKRDIEKAKQLLADAGATGLKATLNAPDLQEIKDLAQLVQSNCAEAGIELTLNIEGTDTFYEKWCLTYPCAGGAEFGIVDYGHRATPDTYLNAAFKTGGQWNASQYSSTEFDDAFGEYQKALDVDGHKAACKKIETVLNEDVPAAIPYFYNYLSAHTDQFQGIRVSALGQIFLDQATKTK